MTVVWPITAALFLGTVALKAAGPLTLGRRRPPERALAVISLVAPAILTGLAVYETLNATPLGITLDARVAGLVVALAAALAKLPMIVVVILAAATAAGARLLG
jgi:branched chain amino acid efflux pump